MQNRLLYLLAACLILSACADLPKPPPLPTKPLLDSALAQACKPIIIPETQDIDIFLAWVKYELFRDYGDCAILHKKTVEAWPK